MIHEIMISEKRFFMEDDGRAWLISTGRLHGRIDKYVLDIVMPVPSNDYRDATKLDYRRHGVRLSQKRKIRVTATRDKFSLLYRHQC